MPSGGVDPSHDDPARHQVYVPNHFGQGFHDRPTHPSIDGKPLPNTKKKARPVTDPRGRYRPMAFGPIFRRLAAAAQVRGYLRRKCWTTSSRFSPPILTNAITNPAEDQQTEHLQGGEEVELLNLTPTGRILFRLPRGSLPVIFQLEGDSATVDAVADTLVFEPDKSRFMILWRLRFRSEGTCLKSHGGCGTDAFRLVSCPEARQGLLFQPWRTGAGTAILTHRVWDRRNR